MVRPPRSPSSDVWIFLFQKLKQKFPFARKFLKSDILNLLFYNNINTMKHTS